MSATSTAPAAAERSLPDASVEAAWQRYGSCRGEQVDSDIFFPATGKTALPAQLVCLACPVLTRCATWAVELRHTDHTIGDVGVWGATTPNDRKAVRRGEVSLQQVLDRVAARACRRRQDGHLRSA